LRWQEEHPEVDFPSVYLLPSTIWGDRNAEHPSTRLPFHFGDGPHVLALPLFNHGTRDGDRWIGHGARRDEYGEYVPGITFNVLEAGAGRLEVVATRHEPQVQGYFVELLQAVGRARPEARPAIDAYLGAGDGERKRGRGGARRMQDGSDAVLSILFLAADPTDASRLRLGEEFREIQGRLKLAKFRERFRLELPQLSVRPADISQALLDVQPQIVHFSGHGTSTGALCFENQLGQTQLVEPDALAALFEQFAHQVSCVLLNACYSEAQAKSIAEHINYVVGMSQSVGDRAAIAFAVGFYQALGAGRTIEEAFKLGCIQIRLQGIPEHLTPVFIKKGQTQL
jgi:hypothetical protein